LGWFLAPPALVPVMDRLSQNLYLAPPTVAQHAALVALSEKTRPLLEANKEELGKRRDWLLPQLAQLGFDLPVQPDGAFYVYAGLNPNWAGATSLTHACLHQAGVAITPGTDFGATHAERFVRFAYTTRLERIQEAMHRLSSVLSRLS
jgi:aspartate/methionine/tyrosine aminotransferase